MHKERKKCIILILVVSMFLCLTLSTTIKAGLTKNSTNDTLKIKAAIYSQSMFQVYDLGDFGQGAYGLTSADFNNDGNIDFAASYGNSPFSIATISIFYNDGNLGFVKDEVFTFTYDFIFDLDAGDYDNDGDIDLMFTYSESEWPVRVTGVIKMLKNKGDNTFSNPILIARHDEPGVPHDPENRINPQLTSADYDVDGDIDFLVGDNSGKVEFYMNDGTGYFYSAGILHDYGNCSWGLTSADFDGDEDIDFLVAAEKPNIKEGLIYIKRNNGLSTCFETGPGEILEDIYIYNTPATACLQSIDYDKDSDEDFIAGVLNEIYLNENNQVNFKINYLGLLPNNPQGYNDNLNSGGLTSADYNKDGYEDFIAGGVQGCLRVFINLNGVRPKKPTISGPTSGKVGEDYTYTATTTDPQGEKVWFKWSWGDETPTEWEGPYNSGDTCKASHKWEKWGKYTVKVKAKDENDYVSDWATLSVKMPRNRAINNPLLTFLKNYPNMFLILRYILKLR